MEITHKGWDWTTVTHESWNRISEEFLPVALQWKEKFNSILDIGTGKGRHAFFFAKAGFEVNAIDLSTSSIAAVNDEAQKSNLNITTGVADMTKLPFEDNQFDCVICFHTIYHTDYNGVKQAICEIKRVLKEHGEAFITFNTKENPHFVESESIDGYTMIREDGHEKGIPHCYLDVEDIFEVLSDFTIQSMNKVQNFVREGRESHGIHYYVHIIKK